MAARFLSAGRSLKGETFGSVLSQISSVIGQQECWTRDLPLCLGAPQVPQTVGACGFQMDVMFMVVEVERGAGFVVSVGGCCNRRRPTREMTSEPHLSAPSHLVPFRKSSNVFILKAQAQSTMWLSTSAGMASKLPISWRRACPYSAIVVFSHQSSRAFHRAQSSGVILLVGICDLAGR
jgi:hypothetical protein